MGSWGLIAFFSTAITHEIFEFGVFLIVAIETQEFPITSVRRIVIMVVVDMMHS